MIRLKRLLHLTGEGVTRLPPRAVEGALVSVVRVELAARNEDLASVSGYGPFSALRGSIDFVELPLTAFGSARGFLAFVPPDGQVPARFHIEMPVPAQFGFDFENWWPPFELLIELEPPTDPRVDPTDPWTWDVENEPTLPVRGFAGGGAAPE